jgi:Ca2+-binding RTX toxin-like protein
MLETLEIRRMLSITIAGSRITVSDGDIGGSVITVEQNGAPNSFLIFENGITTVITSNRIVTQIVVNGNEGDDTLVVHPSITAATTLNGGPGNDTMIGGGGRDTFFGGTEAKAPADEHDTVDYHLRDENLVLTIDGIANDGKAGEGDNIMTDVEDVIGGFGDDLIRGQVAAAVNNWLIGGPGYDDIYGYGGNDLLDGGPNDDSMVGGDGDDVFDGGIGNDTMLGGNGNDTFYAFDGEYDGQIIGGADTDTAFIDTNLASPPFPANEDNADVEFIG